MSETKRNRNLGNYDMVLGLSSSKINHHFKLLHKRKLIHQKWAFLACSTTGKVENLVNENAEDYWKNREIIRDQFNKTKKELDEVDRQRDIELNNDDLDIVKVKELSKKKNTLKEKKEKLQKEVDDANKYDLALFANIAAPEIEISHNPKELIFKVKFEAGSKIYYTKGNESFKYDLGAKIDKKSISYAFKVSIGKVRINDSNKEIIEIDGNGNEKSITLRDKGINDNDFNIDSLFLDFENANITDYDQQHSKLTDEIKDNAWLQVLLTNYFRNLKNTDNPYILGYAISKKELKNHKEKAVLYPTGVAYSTSYSSQKHISSTFNFLMLLNHHDFPSGGDAGVLPKSLLELAEDETPTVNGVFGISLYEFENNYVNKLSQDIGDAVKKSLENSEAINEAELTNKGENLNVQIKFKGELKHEGKKEVDLAGNLSINYLGITEVKTKENKKEISINYDIEVTGEIHKNKNLPSSSLEVDYYWAFSTNEQFKKGKREKGKITIILKASNEGKLAIKPIYDEFSLSYNDDPNAPTRIENNNSTWEKTKGILKDVIISLSPGSMIVYGIKDFFESFSKLKIDDLNNIGEEIKIGNFDDLENKVILPVASVYTYKNVRLIDTDKDSKTILFDVSYAPVSK